MSFKLLSFLILFVFFFSSSVAPVLAAITYTYDANGNMTSDGTKCFQYNEANQMDKVTNCANGQTIAEYVYDHSGIRLVKKEFENGVLKRTIYSPADEYETVKMASNGATANTTYYKANDEVAAKKNPDGTKTYYQNDHLGSTAVLSNQAGAQVEKTVYAPYGEVKSGGTVSKFGYTGQEQDNETGLDYYNARYYNPHIQRFIQADDIIQDPYNPQNLNKYSYVENNPIKYTDPSGHNKFLTLAYDIFTNPGAVWQSITKGFNSLAKTANNVKSFFTKPAGQQTLAKVEQVTSGKTSYTTPSTQIQQITQKGTDSLKYITDKPQNGWKVGDPINNFTSNGNKASWSTIRQRFWKNEAASQNGTGQWNQADLERMRKGLAPQRDGSSLQLDHWPAQRDGGLYEFNIMTKEEHQIFEILRRQEGLY